MSKASKVIAAKKSNKNVGDTGYLKTFRILLLFGILFVIFYTPFLRGLYFESEQLFTEIVLLSIFTLFWVHKWLKKDKTFIRTPIEYASLGLVLAYLLTTFTAVNQRLAVAEFLKYAMYFIVFIMLSDLIKSEKEKTYVFWAIVASAFGVCIIGIDSVAGGKIVNIFNAIFKAVNINISFFGLYVDGRIHSTMQYPNALASYLMAAFFISMGLALTSKKWWVKGVASSIGFVLLTTFIFTLSRGAYILLLLALPLYLLLLPNGTKARGVYCLVTLLGITGPLAILLSKVINNASGNKSLIWLLVLVGALMAFFVRFTDEIATKLLNKIKLSVAVICSSVLVVIVAVGLVFIFNASLPLELKHAIDEKDEFKGKTKTVALESNKKYNLVFEVEAKSENEKAEYAYMVYMKTKNETSISSVGEVVLIDKKFNSTNGIEKKQIEFEVPESSGIVSVTFQNYYAGTSATFYEAKIYEADSGKEKRNIILKHKYSFAESILSRFENITTDKSYNTRIMFIKDGFKIFKDWWLIGAGGGAWSLLNFKYQSFLYWSTQTHNYFLQVLVETGLIGILFLMLLCIFIVVGFIKLMKNRLDNSNNSIYNISVFTAIILLFLHSAMDFDFSLSAIYLLTWQLIALLNVDVSREFSVVEGGSNLNKSVKTKAGSKLPIVNFTNFFRKGLNVYPVIMIIISVVVLIWPILFMSASVYAERALESYKESDLDKAIEFMESALELDYLNTEYITGYIPISSKPEIRLGYIDLLVKKLESDSKKISQSKDSEDQLVLKNYLSNAQKLAKRAEKQAKYNSSLSLNLGVYYLNTSEKEKGIDYINKSVELKPLVPSQWQYKANALYATALYYYQQDNKQKGFECLEKVLGIIDEAKKVNEYNLLPFKFNEETQKYIEKAYQYTNQSNINNFVFQSIFEMDVDNDNIPDQWTINDKTIMNNELNNGIYTIERKNKNITLCMYTRSIELEEGSTYRVEVELVNSKNIESIPFQIIGITEIEQLNPNNSIFSSEFTVSKISENMKLAIYIEDKYDIKNVKIIKTGGL